MLQEANLYIYLLLHTNKLPIMKEQQLEIKSWLGLYFAGKRAGS